MRRIADATRAKLDGWRDRKVVRIDGKALSELSDAELESELARRRRARGHKPAAGSSARGRTGKAPGWKVRQWYRDLELEPKSSREQVEEAYQRLMKKYDPDKYDDAEKRRAAVRLVVGLREAYDGLIEQHFEA